LADQLLSAGILQANRFNHEPRRPRKLLLKKREMARLDRAIKREGMTLVPLKIYFNDQGRAKLAGARPRQEAARQARDRKERDWPARRAG
jgi:SsrA-binding protein